MVHFPASYVSFQGGVHLEDKQFIARKCFLYLKKVGSQILASLMDTYPQPQHTSKKNISQIQHHHNHHTSSLHHGYA